MQSYRKPGGNTSVIKRTPTKKPSRVQINRRDSSEIIEIDVKGDFKRLVSNRESQKRSREKKKDYIAGLESLSKKLKSENMMYKKFIIMHRGMPETFIFQNPSIEKSKAMHEMFMNTIEAELKCYYSKQIEAPVANLKGPESVVKEDLSMFEALNSSRQSFVISNPALPDNPIIFCSDNFCELTGYSKEEILGRNCRFLQGPETDKAVVKLLGDRIREGRGHSCCFKNYKKDGTQFWNFLTMSPMRDIKGNVVMCVGVQQQVEYYIQAPNSPSPPGSASPSTASS